MSLFRSVKPLIQICQFAGLAPVSMNQNTLKWESNPSLNVISIIIIICNASIFISVIIFNDLFIDYHRSPVQRVLLSALLLFNGFHALCALLELFIKRDQQLKLLSTFEHIDESFQQHLNIRVNYAQLKKNCYKIIAVWICEIGGLLFANMLVFIQKKDIFDFLYFSIYVWPFILSKLSYAYFAIFVTLVNENIDVLNKYLRSTNKQNGYYIRDSFFEQNESKFMRNNSIRKNAIALNPKTLLFIKSIYFKIWESSLAIQHLTRWSLTFGLFYEFFVLIFNSYWFVSCVFFYPCPITVVILLLQSVIINLCNIFIIAGNCNKAVEGVSYFFLSIIVYARSV